MLDRCGRQIHGGMSEQGDYTNRYYYRNVPGKGDEASKALGSDCMLGDKVVTDGSEVRAIKT